MTIEQRLEQVEQQNNRIQRTNKRLTVALTKTVVAMCGAIAMGGKKTTEEFVSIRAKSVTAEYISALSGP